MSIDLRKPRDTSLDKKDMPKKVIFEQTPSPVKNVFKTVGKKEDRKSPGIHVTPQKDIDFESDEFNKMYHEHLRRKEEIRLRIEKMTREKHFLEQLKPNDVAYMFQKKHEFALKDEKETFN